MFKSIKFKLWLTIAAAIVLSLGALLGLTHYGMHKSFVSFSLRAVEEQLPPLAQNIANVFKREQTLDAFTTDTHLWRRTIYKSLPFTRVGPEPPPNYETKKPKEVRINDLQSNQKRFTKSLALYDHNKKLIAGETLTQGKLLWHKITVKASVIGYIAYEKPKYVIRRSEQVFLQQQLKFFIYLSAAMLIAAVFLATFISRWLVQPLSQLSQGASKVAQGDFSARVDIKSPDELGELCQHFNEMTQKLEANEKARRQWIADISHEMRTPVAVLKGQIEAIQDGIRPSSQENILILSNKVEALNHLINDLFELTLSDIGEFKLNLEAINIFEPIKQFVTENTTRANAAGLNFKYENHEKSPLKVSADEHRLGQVFNNLFENSLRYTDAPGDILWTIKRADKNIMITFDDSSPNVPAEQLNQIFDRLYRVEKSRNRATGGAGLGLSLCRNIIDNHGGHIASSMSHLGGLRITVMLPIMEAY